MYDCRLRPGSDLTMRDVYTAVVRQAAAADLQTLEADRAWVDRMTGSLA